MKLLRIKTLALCSALLLGGGASAHELDECVIRLDAETQKTATRLCELRKIFGELGLEYEVDRLMLKMPNLKISAIDYTRPTRGFEHEFAVEVTNDGTAPARAPWLLVLIQGHWYTDYALVKLGDLAPGDSEVVPLQPFTQGPDSTDRDITVTAIVDPVSAGRPNGEIWESDENDNRLIRTVTVTGF